MTGNPFTAIRGLLQEAQQLGASVSLTGADVIVAGLESLPLQLQEGLKEHQQSGTLWLYLGGPDSDDPACDLAAQLGVTVNLVDSVPAAKGAVRRLIADMQQHGGLLGLDIETAPLPAYAAPREPVRLNKDGGLSVNQPKHEDPATLDPHRSDIALLQLYAGGDACFVFRGEALRLVARSRWLRRQRMAVHNLGFEAAFIGKHRPPPSPVPRKSKGRLECTMQATGLVFGVGFDGSGRSLAVAAKKLLDLDVPKELATSDWGARNLSEGQLAYAAADAVIAWRMWPQLADRMLDTGVWNAYALQRGAIAAVVDMEQRGLGFDRDEHVRQSQKWADELEQARQEYKAATSKIPPSTPDQRIEWLQTVLSPDALERWPRTDTGKLSTKSQHLKRLVHVESARPVLAMVAMEQLISTFGPSLVKHISPATGRIHCAFGIAATKAGRFSARHPNLQQLPSRKAPEFRRCIRARPRHVLVSCDWNQVELRAAAWISGDYAMTELYRVGGDLHAENAAAIAGVSLDAVTSEQRQAAKAVSFGSLYGIGPAGLVESAFNSDGVTMTLDAADRALMAFFGKFPQLAQWRTNNYNLCQRQRAVRIGAGRLVKAEWEKFGSISFPQCCNLPIQGICADAMLRAITLVHARLAAAKLRGGLVATIHDELLAEVHEEDAAQAKDILQQSMIEAFEVTFPGAPTERVAEAKIGPTWADVK